MWLGSTLLLTLALISPGTALAADTQTLNQHQQQNIAIGPVARSLMGLCSSATGERHLADFDPDMEWSGLISSGEGSRDSKGRFIPADEVYYDPEVEVSIEATPSIEASPVVPAPARDIPTPEDDPFNWLPWVGAGSVASAGAIAIAGFFLFFNARVEKDGALIARTRIRKDGLGRTCVLSSRITNKIIPGWKDGLPQGTGAQIINSHKFELIPNKNTATKGGPLFVTSKVGEVELFKGIIKERVPLKISNVFARGRV